LYNQVFAVSSLMKKSPFNLLPFLLTIFLYACHGSHRPVTTIESSDNDNIVTISYNGTVSFTSDSSAIEGLSPLSTLSYRNNDNSLRVTSNEQGQLSFEMTENGNSLLMESRGKEFVAKAVKVMMEKGAGESRQ
jgi:hypothetical protein